MAKRQLNQVAVIARYTLSHMRNMPMGNHHGSIMLSGDPGIGKTTFVDMLGAVLGMKVITIEVPHVTEEHLINIPFIVFDPQTGTSQTSATHANQGPNYKMILADSNLFSQLQSARALDDKAYLDYIQNKAKPDVQALYMALGGTPDQIPPIIQKARQNHKAILFLDEFYRSTSTRIRNLMRGLLNGNIANHKIPAYVYQLYASNMNDSGLDSSPTNYQFTEVDFAAPTAKDWFEWLVKKYQTDQHVKLNPEVMAKFKQALKDEDISYTDAASGVRTSPRRWEQLLMYINAGIPVKDVKSARSLITNVKNNFFHYQPKEDTGHTETHSALAPKVLKAVYELIKETSDIDVGDSDHLGDEDWRDALNHAVEMQTKTDGKRKHIPVVSGPPGIGKTTFAAEVAKDHNMRLIEIDCSTINSDDAIGMPIPGERSGDRMSVRFSMPALHARIMQGIEEKDEKYINALASKYGPDAKQHIEEYKNQRFKYLIFFDEMNRVGDEKTFNALRRVILEKNFGEVGPNHELLKLPDAALCIGAVNPAGNGTTPFTDHFRDVVDVIPAAAGWNATKRYLMGNQFEEPPEMKQVAIDIIEEFIKKFKAVSGKNKPQQAPFHLDIGGAEVYLSSREYTDLFSTIIREVYAGIQEALNDPDVKENEVRDYIDDALFMAFKTSLSFPIRKAIGLIPEEFFPQLKGWIHKLPDALFGAMMTKKAKGITAFENTLVKYLEGRDLKDMLEDEHFTNANDSSGDAQIMDEVKAALKSKITDDAAVQKYILDATHPMIILKDGSLVEDGGTKVSNLENLFRAIVSTLHEFNYANNRLNVVCKALSQMMTDLNKTLVKEKKISQDLAMDASHAVTEIRGNLMDLVEGFE